MKMHILGAFSWAMLCFIPLAWTAPLTRLVPVSVDIVVSQPSPDLEIYANHTAFQVRYDTTSQRFSPLDIPFTVRSVSGQSVAYNFSLSQLAGQCDAGMTGLTLAATLDGISIEVNEQRRFAGIENDHVLTLLFPLLPQTSVAQQCEGYASIVAELTL